MDFVGKGWVLYPGETLLMGELGEMSVFTKISAAVRKIWPCMGTAQPYLGTGGSPTLPALKPSCRTTGAQKSG